MPTDKIHEVEFEISGVTFDKEAITELVGAKVTFNNEMTEADRFNAHVEEALNRVRELLSRKGEEYGRSGVFHNFECAAVLTESTVPQALGGMMIKHIVSIYDMIGDYPQPAVDMWKEKIGDAMTYLSILYAYVMMEDSTDE